MVNEQDGFLRYVCSIQWRKNVLKEKNTWSYIDEIKYARVARMSC